LMQGITESLAGRTVVFAELFRIIPYGALRGSSGRGGRKI